MSRPKKVVHGFNPVVSNSRTEQGVPPRRVSIEQEILTSQILDSKQSSRHSSMSKHSFEEHLFDISPHSIKQRADNEKQRADIELTNSDVHRADIELIRQRANVKLPKQRADIELTKVGSEVELESQKLESSEQFKAPKQKEMTKAQRRELQEKQRALKAEKTPKPIAKAPPPKKQIKKETIKESEKPQTLFSHLPQHERESSIFSDKKILESIHPAVFRLGKDIFFQRVNTSNSRCVGMLSAFQKALCINSGNSRLPHTPRSFSSARFDSTDWQTCRFPYQSSRFVPVHEKRRSFHQIYCPKSSN
jgi:hypothetical protein